MKQILRFILTGLIVLLASAAGLFGYLIYTPEPAMPALSGTLTKATLELNGETYTYRLYLPKGFTKGAPLVMVLHGSGQNGAQIRTETGYGFERLADQHGFGVVYPSGKSFDWNDCSKTGDFLVNGRELDDVQYLNTLVDMLIAAQGFVPTPGVCHRRIGRWFYVLALSAGITGSFSRCGRSVGQCAGSRQF